MNTPNHRHGRSALQVVLMVSALLLASLTFAQEREDVTGWLQDGAFYFAQGDCALAQYFYQEALKRDPENLSAMVGRGRAMSCLGAFPAAIDNFRAAIDSDPNHAPAYVQLALTYQRQYLSDRALYGNRLTEAVEVLNQAARLAPTDPTVFNTQGIVYFEMGDLARAQTALLQAVELMGPADLSDAERSVIQVNLGRTYRDLGQLEMAQAVFRRAVVLDPNNAAAHNNLGNINFRLGDCAGAEFELSQAVSLMPSSLSTVSQLAVVLFECGDIASSIPFFERALTLDGAVFAPPLYTYLARAYVDVGRYEDAVRRAQQGALLPPESANAHYFLGLAYVARGNDGDREAALASFGRALELNPNSAEVRQALENLR